MSTTNETEDLVSRRKKDDDDEQRRRAEELADQERSRYAKYRDRKRGGPPRQPKPHGTYAGFRRHKRRGEEPCAECYQAWLDYQAQMFRNRQARKAASS